MAHSEIRQTVTPTAIRPVEARHATLTPAHQRWIQVEAGLLAIVSPVLLFPTVTYWGTGLAVVLLVALWIGLKHKYQIAIFPNLPFSTPLKLLVCTIALSIVFSVDYELTYRKAAGVFFGLCWLRTIARTAYLENHKVYLWAPLVVFASVTVGAGVLTVSWPAKISALEPFIALLPQNKLALPNSPAAGAHVNQLAGALTLIIPVAASWLLAEKKIFRFVQRLVAPSLFLLLLAIVLLTQSRTAYLAVVVSLLIGALLHILSHAASKTVAASVVLGLIACALIGLVASPLLLAIGPDTPTAVGYFDTIAFRKEIWYWAIEAIHDFPFTGTGLGTFRRVVQRLYPVAIALDYDGTHAHNIFLQVAVDTGVLGLISYCAVLLTAAASAWNIATTSAEFRPAAVGLLCGIIGCHIFGLSDALVLGSKPGILFWVELGMVGHLSIVVHSRNPKLKEYM